MFSLGIQVTYDMGMPSGQRVVKVSVLCNDCQVPKYEPLQPSGNYGIVMPVYLAGGGDGFKMFSSITEYTFLGKESYTLTLRFALTIILGLFLHKKHS